MYFTIQFLPAQHATAQHELVMQGGARAAWAHAKETMHYTLFAVSVLQLRASVSLHNPWQLLCAVRHHIDSSITQHTKPGQGHVADAIPSPNATDKHAADLTQSLLHSKQSAAYRVHTAFALLLCNRLRGCVNDVMGAKVRGVMQLLIISTCGTICAECSFDR